MQTEQRIPQWDRETTEGTQLAVLDVVSIGTGVVAVPLNLSISGITEAFAAEVEYDLLLLVTDTFKMLLVGKCCTPIKIC